MITTNERDIKVLETLKSSDEPLGPTEIARRIDEDWCVIHCYPMSNTIMPCLLRLIRMSLVTRVSKGRYASDKEDV